MFKRTTSVHIVACGTSYHAGIVARYFIEQLCRVPCRVEIASEFRYRDPVVPANSLFVSISQSGETADTLAALRLARKAGFLSTLAICNVPESSLVRESELTMLTRAGPEIGVASTKAFTTQLAALGMLVIAIGKHHGLPPEREKTLVQRLLELPAMLEQTLALDPVVKDLAKRIEPRHHALFLGRGAMFPIAMEGALKLKEISYIHAEAYAAGELKHGPLALVDEDMPVIAVAPNNDLLEKVKSNLQEVRARGGMLYVFADPDSGHRAFGRRGGHHDAAARELLPGAGGLHAAAAAPRVPHGGAEGHRRRPAAQPREERHRRIERHLKGTVTFSRPRNARFSLAVNPFKSDRPLLNLCRRGLLPALLRGSAHAGRLACGYRAARAIRLRLHGLPGIHRQARARRRLRPRTPATAGTGIFPACALCRLETSEYLCRRHGWVRESVADYAPGTPFDLVLCHDVLQYLDDRAAVRALVNLGKLSRGALYFSVLTVEDWRRNADRERTDSGVRLRPAAWYKARLSRHFRPIGGGLMVRRGYDPLLWELERPW